MRVIKLTIYSIFCLTALTFATQVSQASVISYAVTIDTSFLTDSPYFIDFQFSQGEPSEVTLNTAEVTFLNLPGASSDFTLQDGLPDGSSPSPSEDFFSFTAGQEIFFDVAITDSVSPGPTPDLLAIYIEDGSGTPLETTDALNGSVVSFQESLDPNNPGVAVSTFDTPAGNQFNATVQTPEPGTLVLGSLCLLLPVALRKKRLL
jgi:hypothetical protein